MMLQVPLVPRMADGILRVILPGRISTPHQDMEAIATTQADMAQWLKHSYSGPTEIMQVGEQASGWLVDRKSMRKVEAAIQNGECDLVLVREVREIYRNPELIWRFIHKCLDNDVRVICVWDYIDTAVEGWETPASTAVLRASMARPETRKRVKSKATYTFNKGGMVLKVRYGYRKLTKEEANSGQFGPQGLRIAKIGECTPTISEIRRRLLARIPPQLVVDWLDVEGILPGPYVTAGRWSVRVLLALMRDPILSGRRRFRKDISRFYYGTGRHKAQPNPNPLVEECPELAHMSVEEQQELIEYLATLDKNKDAQKSGKDSPLWNVSRSRSLWPGQAVRCGICGGRMYDLGTGLKCQNTIPRGPRTCWNRVLVSIDKIHEHVIPEVTRFLDRNPSSRRGIAREGWDAYQKALRREGRSDLSDEIAELEVEEKNLARAVGKNRDLDALVSRLREVQDLLKAKRDEDRRRKSRRASIGNFKSIGDIEAQFESAMARMARGSRDFADVLRRLIPQFVIQPVQALDRPQVRPRAILTLSTAAWMLPREPAIEETITLDLFEAPDHIRHLHRCLETRREMPKATLQEIGTKIEVHKMTVKRAFDYARRMEEAGTNDPYRVLNEAPTVASRWRKRRSA